MSHFIPKPVPLVLGEEKDERPVEEKAVEAIKTQAEHDRIFETMIANAKEAYRAQEIITEIAVEQGVLNPHDGEAMERHEEKVLLRSLHYGMDQLVHANEKHIKDEE